jgi:ABC-type branched-subunit amino acid transport system substrate-binding protein
MRIDRKITFGLLGALAIVAAACSSNSASTFSGSSTTVSSSTGSRSHVYTLGILTDLTGPGASVNKTAAQGVQAGIWLASQDGYTIKYVAADTGTSPSGALAAAQQLVQQDHVDAVVALSALTFAASNWLTEQGVPVVGAAEDGPEWITSMNMFSVFGPLDTTKVTTTWGSFFKLEGATNVGTLGYSIAPTSSEAAQAVGVSAENAGLKAGYVNGALPFGSTNVQPVAIAMKSAGVDAFTSQTDPNTSFALLTALRQEGVDPKVALMPTGYGGDLQQAGPGVLQEAQGVYFLSVFEPVEMHTSATQQFQKALKSAGVTHDPTYAEYAGYTSVALFIDALQSAGANPTSSQLITALSGIKSFDAAGLLDGHTLNMAQRTGIVNGPGNCIYMTKAQAGAFVVVANADPICGTVIPGKTVSAAH